MAFYDGKIADGSRMFGRGEWVNLAAFGNPASRQSPTLLPASYLLLSPLTVGRLISPGR